MWDRVSTGGWLFPDRPWSASLHLNAGESDGPLSLTLPHSPRHSAAHGKGLYSGTNYQPGGSLSPGPLPVP